MEASVKVVNLSEVAEVSLGQTFRGKAESSDRKGHVQLIQIKDLFKGIIKDTANLPFAAIENPKVEARLLPNDILLPIRGGKLVATLYQPQDPKRFVITTNHVAIIRMSKTTVVNQDYLFWLLNSEYGTHLLSQLVQGTMIQSINKNDLLSLKFDLPNDIVQTKVGKCYLNWLEQEYTLKAMIENGAKLTEKYCSLLANTGNKYE